jgi:hypothetical protein
MDPESLNTWRFCSFMDFEKQLTVSLIIGVISNTAKLAAFSCHSIRRYIIAVHFSKSTKWPPFKSRVYRGGENRESFIVFWIGSSARWFARRLTIAESIFWMRKLGRCWD